ncbi:MAG: DinB family protein [Gemmatimonadota bacterium]|nr:DinB family protein [Gemmatimonadota bacterium]
MDASLSRLFDHLRWADAGVQASLTDAVNPPPHTLDLFAHVVAAEHVWLSRIGQVKPEVEVWPKLSLAQCLELATRNADEFSALVESLDDIGLDGGVTYRNSAGLEFTSSVRDILLHVALHGAYHRGQIAAAVRAGGDTPASTDYIAFVRGTPAARRS